MNSNQTPAPGSSHDGDHHDRRTPVSPFRLPHESGGTTPRAARRIAPAVAPSPSTGSDDVQRVARRRTSARRTVSGLSVGLVLATGVGVGALTWAAQQAGAGTTAAATTTGTSSGVTTDSTASDDSTVTDDSTATDDSTSDDSTTGTASTTSSTGTTSSGVTVTAASGTANAGTNAS